MEKGKEAGAAAKKEIDQKNTILGIYKEKSGQTPRQVCYSFPSPGNSAASPYSDGDAAEKYSN
ncbi:hypothetical protein D3C77_419270 [compost metagenome]